MRYLDTMAPEARRSILVVAGFIVVLVFLFGYSQFFAKKGTPVRLDVVPSDAVVTLDGKRLSTGTVRLSPGEHTFTAKKSGFEKAEDKVSIKEGSENKSVQLLLTPVSPNAIAWAEKNQKLYQRAEQKAVEDVVKEGEEFQKKFPLSKLLPFNNLLFSIDYKTDESSTKFTVQIEAKTPTDRAYALGQIRNWGYDPADYLIEFVDFANPLRTGD